ncbi:DDB1- and CUL4-associated factor 1-like [Dendronephthya gigantea]|uniref:DDB1- and CUL4-associated factor 1-like n=1 Tax=Dendronephthya gigantea TaxID=151771 RepID=UPI00106926CC|nr:DDB1- and CUL4-associated factor 1-like [Dendronephthya gigantea]
MTALDTVNDIAALLVKWEEAERQHICPIESLERIADVVEAEYEAFLKSDPDPFDDRHPGRNDPFCTYAHVLKCLSKSDNLVEIILNTYLMAPRWDFKLCCVASRLLFDLMCCLEMEQIYQETEGLLLRLYNWAENGEEPLRSYSLGLLGIAMGMQDFTSSHRENNSHLVPIVINRLKSLKDLRDLSQPAVKEFPKPKAISRTKNNGKSNGGNKNKKESILDSSSPAMAESSSKSSQSSARKESKKTRQFLKPSSFKLSPLTLSAQIRLMLRYLTPLGEYQEFLQVAFELDVRSMVTHFINVKHIAEDGVIFQALQYLTSLMCHKKFAQEFVSHGGIERLLQIPKPSTSATAVSCCFYYLAYVEDALERICLLPQPVLTEVVKYVLWLLECSHFSGRCHATIFFSLTFPFRAILSLFDTNDGLRKLINMLSTLEILTESSDVLSDDYLFDCRQTVKHTCMALRRYFDAQIALKADILRRSLARSKGGSPPPPTPAYKSMTITQTSMLENIELLLENSYVISKWPSIDMMMNLQGFPLLIQIICLSADWNSYTARNDVTRLALDTLAVLTACPKTQLALIEPVTLPTGVTEIGIRVLLRAAEGELSSELAADGETQKAALLVLCNCVCSSKQKGSNSSTAQKLSKGKRSQSKNTDDIQQRLWNCVRANNGIRVLLSLLLVKTPVSDADSIRALACRALCGLAQSDGIRQIMSKLPMVHSGQLQLLMREPILADNANEHRTFCKYVSELLERVLGKAIHTMSYFTLSKITKADVVTQTKITYPDHELFQLVYKYLDNCGLRQTASTLAKETNLPLSKTSQKPSLPVTPTLQRKVRFNVSRPSPLENPSTTLTPISSPGGTIVHRFGSTNSSTPIPKHNLSAIAKRPSSSCHNRSPSPPTLDSIVTQYLRNQHAKCPHPVSVCPPFSLLGPHRCPEPKRRCHASMNIASRLSAHQVRSNYGGYEGNRLNRRYLYSRFRSLRVLRVLDEASYYTCASFLPNSQEILIGTQAGEIKVFNSKTAECLRNHNCHRSHISSCIPSNDGQLLLTSSPFGTPQSTLWSVGEQKLDIKLNFSEARHVRFSNQGLTRIIGTRGSSADIYDLGTGQKITTLSDTKNSNSYLKNIATFNLTDELVLNDGLLWDVRGSKVIHKFDKFNNYVSGVFHPSDLEIIINSEIWDLRSFHLLDTCPSLDQCRITFNSKGDVIFGVRHALPAEGTGQFESSFKTIDALKFQQIATYDVKKAIYSLAIDKTDTTLAVVENQGSEDSNGESTCRLYEIGRTKREDEDEDEDEEDEDEADDDLESRDDDDDDGDDLADFIVDDDENETIEVQDLIEDMFRRDFDEHFNNDRADIDDHMDDNYDDDDDDDDDDEDDDDDDDYDDSEFDDDVRFLLASDSSDDSYSEMSE